MRRGVTALSVSLGLALISGGLWYVWLSHEAGAGCTFYRDGLVTALVAIALVGGSVIGTSRFRAWQIHSQRAGAGFGVLALWLVVVALVAVNVIFAGNHHCFD